MSNQRHGLSPPTPIISALNQLDVLGVGGKCAEDQCLSHYGPHSLEGIYIG